MTCRRTIRFLVKLIAVRFHCLIEDRKILFQRDVASCLQGFLPGTISSTVTAGSIPPRFHDAMITAGISSGSGS